MFARRELELLATVADQAASVVENVVLSGQLMRSRERIVAAREEERRRLRRDLHDGLGPQLTGVGLGLDLIAETAGADSPGVSAQAQRLRREVSDALADVRRLVEGLRPPRLDDVGLVGAICELAGNAERSGVRVEVRASEDFPGLPAAVEVAAYRIVAEALTKVVRHSHARRCSVELTAGANLRLAVEDDGVGIAEAVGSVVPAVRVGTGTFSMVERAEELGGTCRIGPSSAGGVRVEAMLPTLGSMDKVRQ